MTQRLRDVLLFVGLISFAIILTGSYQSLKAQVGMAQLSGIVTDQSGAVVPNATVTLGRATESAWVRVTATNSAGVYVIPSIIPGTYQLTVSATGFETHTTDNVVLSSGQGSTLDVPLQVGAVKAVVTVNEQSGLLETTTATVGTTIEATKVSQLPINGRNFQSLVLVMPGVSPIDAPDAADSSYSLGGRAYNPAVYGQRQRDNAYTLDGVPNNNLLNGAVFINPPPEAIAEMSVQSGMDSGSYGWAAGGNVDVVTKSGTNNFHGDLWEYIQNNKLNSRSFFSPTIGAYHWNQFGVAIGGPLVIPHLLSEKRGWYIFGYYEGLRFHSAGTNNLALLPTAAELQGNFTGDAPIYNPYTSTTNAAGVTTRTQFPGNIIPSGPTALCAPQATCINPGTQSFYQALLPLPNAVNSGIAGVNYEGATVAVNDYNQWNVRVDHTFGTKDAIYGRYSEEISPRQTVTWPTQPYNQYYGLANIAVGETHTFSPTMVVTARLGMERQRYYGIYSYNTAATVAAGTLAAFPAYYGIDFAPSISISSYPSPGGSYGFSGPEEIWSGTIDAQKIVGRHTLAFGGEIITDDFITDGYSNSETFSASQTSNFVSGTGNGMASYLLGVPSAATRIIGSSAGTMSGWVYSIYGQDSWRVMPKLVVNIGVRWDVAPPMLNAVGSGTFVFETGQYVWDKTNPVTGAGPNIMRGLIPTDYFTPAPRVGIAYQITSKTVARASYSIFNDVEDADTQAYQGNRGNWPFAFPQTESGINTGIPNLFFQNPFPGSPVGPTTTNSCGQCLEADPSATRVPRVQEWSVSVQRQLTPSTKLELAYFGSHGTHLMAQMTDNVAITPGLGPISARQQWPNFGVSVNNLFNLFPSWYDGGVVNFAKQSSHGITFLANYTWSKTIDFTDSLHSTGLGGSNRPTRYDERLFHGPAGFDMRQRFAGSYVWDLPIHTQNKLLNGVVGGWQHAGVLTIDTGLSNVVTLTTDNENIGGGAQFPNLVCNPTANWTPTPAKWFNTACWQIPTYGTLGSSNKHPIYDDGMVSWDGTLAKKWPFRETRDVEFKAEFYNLPNAHSFGQPDVGVGDKTFGVVTSTRLGGRTIQFALKVHF